MIVAELQTPSAVERGWSGDASKSRMLIEEDKLTFRTVTIGDSSVGKTSIVNKFIRDRFDPTEKNTIGALYDSYTDEHEGRQIEVQIWDTAGQEQYRSLSPVYFRSAAAALVVFDITNRTSFLNLNQWLSSFRSASSEKAFLFLVGNKVDLDEMRAVAPEEAREWAARQKCTYFETSARTGDGIIDLFKQVAVTLAGASINEVEAHFQNQKLDAPQEKTGQDGGCC
jgi:small GTP-binding protein